MFDVIAFDADDTLWHNEPIYRGAQSQVLDILAHYRDRDWIERRMYETEIRNLEHYGYGIKGFTLSMIETAIELTEGRISGAEIGLVIELTREMFSAPVAASAPAANSSESPGRNGVTTSPVSANTMTNRIA